MRISITIANKIAKADNPPSIVCGNSDYTIAFDFDSEWDAYALKTARFAYVVCGRLKRYVDVVFSGNECNVPVLSNIDAVEVGVYAGDLHTTTPAIIPCEKSILCDGGVPDAPSEDVYNQIMEALKEFQIVSIVTELPDVGVENKTYFVTKTDGSGNDLYDEYMWINGAWEYIGTKQIEIDLTDYVKNTDYATTTTAGIMKTPVGFAMGANGYAYMIGANKTQIEAKSTHNLAIAPANLDYAVKVGVTTNTVTLTEAEKEAAQKWLGLTKAANEAKPGTVVERSTNGVIYTGTPTENKHAATKEYVDAMGGVFYAEYGVTTFAEITAAIDAGKSVVVTYFNMGNTNFFTLCRHTVNTEPLGYTFSCVYPLTAGGYTMHLGYANINESDEWSADWKQIALG